MKLRCSRCKQLKKDTEFSKVSANKSNYFKDYACKVCQNKRIKNWQQSERGKAARKLWVDNNTQVIRAYCRKYLRNHIEKRKESVKAWRKANPEKYIAIKKKSESKAVDKLATSYIKHLLRQEGLCETSLIPKDLIELRRTQIKFKRLIKEKKKLL